MLLLTADGCQCGAPQFEHLLPSIDDAAGASRELVVSCQIFVLRRSRLPTSLSPLPLSYRTGVSHAFMIRRVLECVGLSRRHSSASDDSGPGHNRSDQADLREVLQCFSELRHEVQQLRRDIYTPSSMSQLPICFS